MKIGFLLAAAPLILLGACNQAEETPVEAAPEVDLAAGTGAYMVTNADGTKSLNFAQEDGVEYGGAMTEEPGAWSVEGDKSCIDPAGDAEKFCFTPSEPGADGSFTNTRDDGTVSGAITPLVTYDDKQGGAWLVANEDGTSGLAVWTADGKSYYAPSVQKVTWRAVDGKRCSKAETEETETCGTPGEMGEDGTFPATNDDGTAITVQMLK